MDRTERFYRIEPMLRRRVADATGLRCSAIAEALAELAL